MAEIKQLKERGVKIYPLTISDALIFSDGTSANDKLSYIIQNYETYSDLVDNLDIEYSVSNKQIILKLGNVTLSTISTDNFAISGVLSSSGYNSQTGLLSLTFTDGTSVSIDLNEILQSVLEDYETEVQSLRNLHTALSESDYEALRVKDDDVYYYTYEDEEEETVS